ncbi:MAG: glycosyltransferase family 4 protein [Planctomycetes bacterium]|nr:glycosyltransferase family 4 protein [Planctomycetota bacterium]
MLTTMNWLTTNGHTVALAAGGDGEIPGVEMIRFRSGAASWWLGGKRSLIDQVQAWKPDLVHLHGAEAIAAARALGSGLELPVVVSVDQILPAARVRALRDAMVSWVLVPTEAHRAHYIGRAKLARDCVSLLPFAIDVEHMAAVGADTVDDALTIGLEAHADDPALLPLVAAVAKLRSSGALVKLAIAVGPGAKRESLINTLAEHQTDGWCEVLGARGHDALISRCDVLVQPSGDERGVAPVIVAMAAGRAVLAAANTGMNELVNDGATGLLVGMGDQAALDVALIRLVQDAALRRRLGEAAQVQARVRYAVGVVGPALVELYQLAVSALQNPGSKGDGSRAYKRRVTTRIDQSVADG